MQKLVVLVSALLASVLLAACGGSALYTESFDDADALPPILRAENLTVGIQNSVAFLSVTETGRGQVGYLFIEPDNLPDGDYTVEAQLRIGSGQASLWLRGDSEGCGGYGLIIDPTLDNYRLSIGTPTCDVQALDTQTRLEVELNQEHALRIEGRGDSIRGFVDEVEFFNITDTTFSDGVPFLRLLTDSTVAARVELDEISVR